jgi:hypothetical protein
MKEEEGDTLMACSQTLLSGNERRRKSTNFNNGFGL